MSTHAQRTAVYNTNRWRRTRALVLARDGNLCLRCAEAGRRVAAGIVHHVKPIEDGGEIWNPANLESVCHRCHEEEHVRLNRAKKLETLPEVSAWNLYLNQQIEEWNRENVSTPA